MLGGKITHMDIRKEVMLDYFLQQFGSLVVLH